MSETTNKSPKTEWVNPYTRFMIYFRQVVVELRKVVWPTKKETISYTRIVLLFVLFVMALVAVVDFGLGKLTLWMFG